MDTDATSVADLFGPMFAICAQAGRFDPNDLLATISNGMCDECFSLKWCLKAMSDFLFAEAAVDCQPC